MKILITAMVHATSAMIAWAAPAGLCLQSYSPLAPPDKIECFEYLKFEKAGEDYRFFLHPNGSTIVPKIRYRGVIAYADQLNPSDPKFDALLALLEKTAHESPATRRFLNQRVLAMRALVSSHQGTKSEPTISPRVTLGGRDFQSPKFRGFENDRLTILHADGKASIDPARITVKEWEVFGKIDPKASKVKFVTIGGERLWNPQHVEIDNGKVTIRHEIGVFSSSLDDLNSVDKDVISSWSDGTWKLAKAGFYGYNPESRLYAELIFPNGRFYRQAGLVARNGPRVKIQTSKGQIEPPLKDLAVIGGMSPSDELLIRTWVTEFQNEEAIRVDADSIIIYGDGTVNQRGFNQYMEGYQSADPQVYEAACRFVICSTETERAIIELGRQGALDKLNGKEVRYRVRPALGGSGPKTQ